VSASPKASGIVPEPSSHQHGQGQGDCEFCPGPLQRHPHKSEARQRCDSLLTPCAPCSAGGRLLSAPALSQLTRTYYIRNTGIGEASDSPPWWAPWWACIIMLHHVHQPSCTARRSSRPARAGGARKFDIFLIVLYQSLMIASGHLYRIFIARIFLYSTMVHGCQAICHSMWPAIMRWALWCSVWSLRYSPCAKQPALTRHQYSDSSRRNHEQAFENNHLVRAKERGLFDGHIRFNKLFQQPANARSRSVAPYAQPLYSA